MRLVGSLALVLVTGCSSILGIDDVTRGDGGAGAVDGLVAPPNTVIGRSITRCTFGGVTVELPLDRSASTVAALIPDASAASGYKTIVGTGKTDGTFEIRDVPDGMTYLLKLGTAYYVTDQHTIDQHFAQPTRCMPIPEAASSATTVTMNVTGVAPAPQVSNASDQIELFSNSLFYDGFLDPVSPALTAPYNWLTGFGYTSSGISLPDAAHGDDVWLLHERSATVAGSAGRRQSVNRLVGTFASTGLTLHDGGTGELAGAFTPVTPTKMLTVSVSRGAFDTGYDALTTLQPFTIDLYAHPEPTNDSGFGSLVTEAQIVDWSHQASLSENFSYSYADPFPASWTRFLVTQYYRVRYLALPGTTTPRPVFGFYTRLSLLTNSVPVLTPTLLPPSNIKVAGKDFIAGGKVAFDGTAPVTVSWNPAANAKVYQLQVSRLYANGSQTKSQNVAGLVTTGVTLSVPAEVFTGGEFFAFTLQAIQSPANYASGEISSNGVPSQFASAPSGMFRLNTTCGNGTIDPGEECDTSGETATCDVDCTLPRCGDGLRNATAGEACDNVRDSIGCDSDCTLPVCGDGHLNPQVEDCDDGNAVDSGNGCSASCKYNGVCGNATVQMGEECDTGTQSATCDSDCTLTECGDGRVNSAFTPPGAPGPEQCDEGYLTGVVGHCKVNCQL